MKAAPLVSETPLSFCPQPRTMRVGTDRRPAVSGGLEAHPTDDRPLNPAHPLLRRVLPAGCWNWTFVVALFAALIALNQTNAWTRTATGTSQLRSCIALCVSVLFFVAEKLQCFACVCFVLCSCDVPVAVQRAAKNNRRMTAPVVEDSLALSELTWRSAICRWRRGRCRLRRRGRPWRLRRLSSSCGGRRLFCCRLRRRSSGRPRCFHTCG